MRLLYRFHSSTMNYLSLDSPSELPVIYTENERRIHEKTKGLFYVGKDNKFVSFTLRFYPSQKCVQEMKGSFNEDQPLRGVTVKTKPGLILD